MKLTGKDGVLRIYDSSDIIAHGAQADMSVFVYTAAGSVVDESFTSSVGVAVQLAHTHITVDSEVVTTTDGLTTFVKDVDYTMDYTAGTITVLLSGSMLDATVYYIDYNFDEIYTDKTAEAYSDDLLYTGAFWAAAGDKIYIGQSTKFARIQFLASVLAVAAGALVPKYYNGSTWTALSGTSDGTASGGDTLAQDGVISFQIPRDWAKGGGGSLSSSMYYIEFAPTTVPTTAPDADILAPVDGQYFEVPFAAMDFSGPIGRPKTEERLVLNRARVDANAHYIEGSDDRIYEPLEVSFSCALDDTAVKDYIFKALACGNPNTGQWTATGVTSKGTTQNDGTNNNPAFKDSAKKAVNVQILWTGDNPLGYSYYEIFFPEGEQSMAESDEAVPLSCKGGVYGVVERIYGFGCRY